MRLYKFKDLADERKHGHFLQIVLEGRIWCASPASLNDQDEFRFTLDCEPSPQTHRLLSEVVARHGTKTSFLRPDLSAKQALENGRLAEIMPSIVEDMSRRSRESTGIVSLSATKDDPHLWKEYGGKGNGACVEICIPDELVGIGKTYQPVCYVAEKRFHIDRFLEADSSEKRAWETYKNMLLTKTKEPWAREQEIRFVSKQPDVNVLFDGYVSEVTFGSGVPKETLEKLTAIIAEHCRVRDIKISQVRCP